MQPEPLGFVVLVAGILALFADDRWTIWLAFAFTVLGAAGAVTLTMLGGASITPPHLFSVFVVLKAVFRDNGWPDAIYAITPPRPGSWLAFVVSYGLFASVIAPGLFPDTLVYAFNRLENGVVVRLAPLTLGSGQITQDVYAVGSVLTFAAGFVLMRQPGASRQVFYGFAACTALNLLFAVLDVATYYAGSADLLEFVRSGGYAQLYSNTEGGVKRIVGSFPEASSFAGYSSILLSFWTSLWMQRYRPRVSGPLALTTCVAILMSTSSTGYVTLAVLFVLFIGSEMLAAMRNQKPKRLAFVLCAVPVVLFFILLAALLTPATIDAASDMLDGTVFNKLNTGSGIERSAWNARAWQNFFDTDGFGIGIGGGRASSYPLILLSNVGLLGTLGFAVFAFKILRRANFRPASEDDRAIGVACRWAFAGNLITSAVSAGVFELGALSYLVAAAAAAVGFQEVAATTSMRPRVSGRPAR